MWGVALKLEPMFQNLFGDHFDLSIKKMFGSQFMHQIQTNLRIVFWFEVLGLENKDIFFLWLVFLSSDQHINCFFDVDGN